MFVTTNISIPNLNRNDTPDDDNGGLLKVGAWIETK